MPFNKSLAPIRHFVKNPVNSIKKVTQGPLTNILLNEILLPYLPILNSCRDFSISHCSYFFLRLNILRSQAHPPTLF